MFKKNDILVIVDKKNPYYLKLGKIVVLQEGILVVEFPSISKFTREGELDNVSFVEENLRTICKILAVR